MDVRDVALAHRQLLENPAKLLAVQKAQNAGAQNANCQVRDSGLRQQSLLVSHRHIELHARKSLVQFFQF